MLNRILVLSLLMIAASGLTYSQSNYSTKAEKMQQLKTREDIKVTEVQKDILKLEYLNGKMLYKNIDDYSQRDLRKAESSSLQKLTYSPTFDSTIIDLTTIDTTLYSQMYSYWQEVPLTNFDFSHILVGDVNNNGKTELYGARKFFETPTEPICIYELDDLDVFKFKYQYDAVRISWNIFDLDKDGQTDVHFLGYPGDQRFFSKENDSSYATLFHTSFIPYDSTYQVNDATLGDFDGDQKTDLLFAGGAGRGSMHIFEYNAVTNNFDSVYRYQIVETGQLEVSGFSVSDFDLDGKTDIVFGTGSGVVHVVENQGNNQFTHVWLGKIESYHAYIHAWTNDIDGNGKPEFWVLGDAYYNGIGTTRITIFETDGNNSYQAVGRVDLVGVFSFYAGTMQAVDIDNDGVDEVAICIDGNFLILKFNGSKDHQTYEVYYIKKNEYDKYEEYYGAIMYDLNSDSTDEILISLFQDPPKPNYIRMITRIYKTDSLNTVINDNFLSSRINLYQNYPNPFNPLTNIKFALNEFSKVSIKIYNILGKEIKTLLEKNLPAGEHTVQWDGKNNEGNILPGGVYFIQMIADSYQKIIKTVLLK